MRVVTTCSRDGFDHYGHRLLETWHHWPAGSELWFYTEGFALPDTKPANIVEINAEKIQPLQAFKTRHAKYIPPNYLYDAVRFSHKVYAAADAFSDFKGIGVWLDADCVMRKDIPTGYIEDLLQGAYMAMFKRRGMYTETGFWIVDCSHPQHESFLQTWVEWYDSGQFQMLANWTDCETLDATVRKFEKKDLIRTVSLSGEFEREMHPMAKVELGAYIDHCKGPRKALGYSPEAV